MDGSGDPRRPEGHAMHEDDTRDIVALLAWLWRSRAILLGVTLACGVIAVLATFLMPTLYTARATLLPEQDSGDSALLTQVAYFTGMAGLGGEASFEHLYFRIVSSDRLLDRAIDRDWPRDGDDPVTLYEVFDVEDGARPRLRERLRTDALSLVRDTRTGFMVLSATVPGDPRLAADLGNFMVDRLDEFNREYRSAKASEQRAFVEERFGIAREALDAADDALTTFVAANRSYRDSPALQQRHAELEREVQAELAVWTELRRQLELAKIDEHKQLATITVLDRATAPERRSSPRRGLVAALGLLVGAALALAFLLARETAAVIRSRA